MAAPGHLVAVVALLTLSLAGSPPGQGQSVSAAPDGLVTVRASAVSLKALLSEVAAIEPFRVLKVDPRVEDRPVTVTVERVTLREALAVILEQAGVDFAFTGAENGRGMRLAAGDSEFVAGQAAALRAPAETPEPEVYVKDPGFESIESVADANPAADPDPAETERRQQELQQALAPPPGPRAIGAPVLLPFPGPDGSPLVGMPPIPGAPRTLPFPGPDGAPLIAPPLVAQPLPTDPKLRQLIQALSPAPPPRPPK